MTDEIPIRKVSIRPIELLKSSYRMLGDQYWLFMGIVLVGMLIGSLIPLGILMGPMMCGIYLCYIHRSHNKPVTFNLLFKGFDYFVESLIATLVMVGVSLLAIVPMYIVFAVAVVGMLAGNDGEPPPAAFFGLMGAFYLVFFVVIILISMPFIFVFPLIVDRDAKAMPAVKASFRAAFANLFGLFGMVLVYSAISMVAACACYIPAFLFMPISFGAMFLVYREIFPEGEKGLT